jgi:hypothetical protein
VLLEQDKLKPLVLLKLRQLVDILQREGGSSAEARMGDVVADGGSAG